MVEEDRSLFDRCFPGSWQTTMLVRPSFQKPTKVALYQRRGDGTVRFDRPAQEFYLYPAHEGRIESPLEPAASSPPTSSEAGHLASVPLQSGSRELEQPGTKLPELVRPNAAAPVDEATQRDAIQRDRTQRDRTQHGGTQRDRTQHAGTQHGGTQHDGANTGPLTLEAGVPAGTRPGAQRSAALSLEFGADAELLPRGTVRTFSPWIAAMLILVGLLAGSGVAALRAPAEPAAASAGGSPLRVVRDSNAWVVHWDRSLADLAGVSGARLSVTRDGYTKEVTLPLMDFRSGSTRLDWVSDEMDLLLRVDRPGYPEVEQRVRVVGMSKPRPSGARAPKA
jgi:hypothetical protein